MSYPTDALATVAACDELIERLNSEKAAFVRKKSDLQQLQVLLNSKAPDYELELASTAAELSSLNQMISALPDQSTNRMYYEGRRTRTSAKLLRFKARQEQYSSTATFLRQIEIVTLDDKIAETDSAIAMVQARRAVLAA